MKKERISNETISTLSDLNQKWFDRNFKIGNLLLIGNVGFIVIAEAFYRTRSPNIFLHDLVQVLTVGTVAAAAALFFARAHADSLSASLSRLTMGMSADVKGRTLKEIYFGKSKYSAFGAANVVTLILHTVSAGCITWGAGFVTASINRFAN